MLHQPQGDPNTDIVIGDDAVRVLGASAYMAEAGQQILSSQDTFDLIVERGEADKASEIGCFPRPFRNVETVPAGMTWPTITLSGKLTLVGVTWSVSTPRPAPAPPPART